MPMNLNQLYYFKKLAELQSYTKTSAQLYISQPSLSYSISNLENELGTSLFEKKGRNVVLTNHGKEFYICIQEVLEKLEHGINTLKQSCDNSKNRISIATLPILPSDFIPKSIKTYMNNFPKTTFDIFTCITTQEVITGVLDGIYDIGFCSKVENENDLVFVPMITQEIVVVTKKEHELSKQEPLTISHLQDYPLITYRENSPLGIYIRNLFKEKNIAPNIMFSFDGEITIGEMVALDFGIAVIAYTPLLRNQNISIIPLNVESDLPLLHLTYKKHSEHSQCIKDFLQLLRKNTTIPH